MPYQVILGDTKLIEDRLNGVILLGPYPRTGLPLGGKTLKIDASTVTFSGSANAMRTIDEVVTQINATVTGLAVMRSANVAPHTTNRDGDGKVVPSVAIALQADGGFTIQSDGTANPLLGIDTTADTVSAGAVDATRLAGFTDGATAGHYAVIVAPEAP